MIVEMITDFSNND